MIGAQLLANGLIAGSIYALVATGFSLVYATNRFMHFAHGTVVTAAAYLVWWLFRGVGLPFWASAILAVITASVIGWLLFAVVYRPLQRRGASNAIVLIAGLSLLFLMENVILLLFGAGVKVVGLLPTTTGISFFGATVTPLQFTLIGVTAALLAVLWYFMRYTRMGVTMRAVADHPELAEVTGIAADRIRSVSFLIASALAGVAGVLIALEQNASPFMGTSLIVKGFTGAIIGGVTSVPGAVLGGYLVGIVENVSIWFLPSAYKDAIAFGLLVLFLLVRPSGILGIGKGARA